MFVTADAALRAALSAVASGCGWHAVFASTFTEALAAFDERRFRCLWIDAFDPGLRGLQLLEWMRARDPFAVTAVFLPAQGIAAPALSLGATAVIAAARRNDVIVLERALAGSLTRWREDLDLKVFEVTSPSGVLAWVGGDPVTRRLIQLCRPVAVAGGCALISGPAGVGKKTLARIQAVLSGVSDVVWFDAAASERERHRELLQAAMAPFLEKERVFLGIFNVDALASEAQIDVATWLEGGNATAVTPIMSVFATTNFSLDAIRVKLSAALDAHLSRHFFRVPALSERLDDVALLAAYFLEVGGGDRVRYFSDDAVAALHAYEWAGNIAELRRLAMTVADRVPGPAIKAKELPASILEKGFYVPGKDNRDLAGMSYNEAKKIALNKFNGEYISQLLARSDGNLTVAAEKAGMDRSNFKKIVRKYFPDE